MRGLSDSTCEARRQKVLSLVSALPEAAAEVCGGRHLSFKVRGKTFGYFLNDHHGDGRVALNCKTAPGVHDTLARVASDRFFIPKYIGTRGWLGLSIDLPTIDWTQVEDVITEAYRLVAPRALLSTLRKTQSIDQTNGTIA